MKKILLQYAAVLGVLMIAAYVFADGPQPSVGLYWFDSKDPTLPPGMTAPLNQLLIRTDVPSVYYKSGAASTAWTLIGTNGSGTVTGSGTANRVTKWTGPTAIGNANPTDDGVTFAIAENASVNTDGQVALFSTKSLGANGNLWIGGGGQSFSGPGMGGTGANTAVGIGAMNVASTTFGCTAVGFGAGAALTNAITTTAIGYGTLGVATSSIDNTCVGYLACDNVTTGQTNTSMGVESMTGCTDCTDNVVYGMSAGQALTHGASNTCVGPSAGCSTTGSFNATLGYGAGTSLTSGIGNVAVGVNTMNTGVGVTGNANTAVGDSALIALTSGAGNFGGGDLTLQGVTSGGENTCAGDSACRFNNVSNSTAFGAFALELQTAGFNAAFGYSAGSSILGGQGNAIFGYNSVTGITSGGFNAIFGSGNTTTGLTTGNFNTIVGSQISGLAAGLSNNVILADGQGNIRIQVDSSGDVSLNGLTTVHGNLLMQGAGNYIQLVDNINAASSRIRAYNANPNGALSGNIGDLTADTTTPALWINTSGGTTWTKVGPTSASLPTNLSALGGTDGSVTFDGIATVLGMVPSGNVYTMARDIMPSTMTVNNGITIKLANYAIFVSGTLTNNGTISNDGNAASGTSGGTTTISGRFSATATGGTAGGGTGGSSGSIPGVWYASTTAGPGANGTANQSNGGGGGSSVALGAGPSGGPTTVSSLFAGDDVALKRGRDSITSTQYTWGSGGSAGKNGAGTNGGGGGAGAGMAMLHAKTFAGTGNIHARGGAGAQGTLAVGVGGGGGGGGGGGFVFITYSTGGGGQTIDANGGAGATAVGDGGAGGNGGSGPTYKVNISGDGTNP